MAQCDFLWSHIELMLRDMLVFFLSVTRKLSFCGSPCWSQFLVIATQGGLTCSVLFYFLQILFFPNYELSVSEGYLMYFSTRENRCALIMHHHFLTICWLNTANRCASSARIILFLIILSGCFSLFSLPWYNSWCLVTVLLPFYSVDHLRSGCSPHTDSHSYGGKAAAAYHNQVSMRMFKRCMINQASDVKAYVTSMLYWKIWKNWMTFTHFASPDVHNLYVIIPNSS